MAGTNLNFPFDSEIFNYKWKTTPDTVLTTMFNSGAVVADAEIARLIANGSNFFTTPFYNDIPTTASTVYNGVTDIASEGVTGGSMSGVVFGRQKGWEAVSFIKDFNSGADPMGFIASKVATFWNRERQSRMLGILKALFAISGDADWATHSTNVCATTAVTPTEANLIGVSSIEDACVKASGDMADGYGLVIVHSTVLQRLKTLQLVEYRKYTDPAGITTSLDIPTINGKLIVVNDNVPVTTNASSKLKEYTTYVLGAGAIRYATAPVDIPSEYERKAATKGGMDYLYTRIREVLHPNGFNFKGNISSDAGVADSILTATASWERKMPAKTIYMAQLVTNG